MFPERKPEIVTPVDVGAVRLIGECFDMPTLTIQSAPDGDLEWRRMAATLHGMDWQDLDAAVAHFGGANSLEAARAHQLVMNVWFFKAEGEHFAQHC